MLARWMLACLVASSFGCGIVFKPGTQPKNGVKRWAAEVPTIRNISGRELLRLPNGSSVLFFHHTESFDRVGANLIQDLEAGGWSIRDNRGSIYYRSIAGCAQSCDSLRFYAVIRRMGPQSQTLLRVLTPDEFGRDVPLPGTCEAVPLARPQLDEASRYGPIFDVDLDRDGKLDAYVPHWNGEKVVWDAMVMRGNCGHRVGTFERPPGDPHTSAISESGLVDLTVSTEFEDESGRTLRKPVTYRFDGSTYVIRDQTPPS